MYGASGKAATEDGPRGCKAQFCGADKLSLK